MNGRVSSFALSLTVNHLGKYKCSTYRLLFRYATNGRFGNKKICKCSTREMQCVFLDGLMILESEL